MLDPFGEDHSSYWIPFTDLFAGILAIFLVVAVLLTFHLREPNQKAKEGDIKSPGSVMVEAFWEPDVDVDIWVKSPQDKPVGYARKQGQFFDLLRDDLGFPSDKVAGRHHENIFARNAPAGEYVVNLHMYSMRGLTATSLPVEVEVAVQLVSHNMEDKSEIKSIIRSKVNLKSIGQEITIVRFNLDDKGDLVPDTVNYDPIPLREAR